MSSRRGFLGLAGASLAAPFLSACGGDSGGPSISPSVSATTTPRIVPTGAAVASASSSSGATASASTLTTAIAANQARLNATTWTEAIGPALDISRFAKTFDTGFSSPDSLRQVTVNGAGGPWYAPIHATSGAARFASPLDKVSPFAIVDRSLRIRCEQVDGAWQTGHMQTCDYAGSGFSQRRGYFEIRCKMPVKGTMGAWPAFWLYSKTFFTDPTKTKAEIDVIEFYPGQDPRGHHSTLHLRPAAKPPANALLVSPWNAGCYSTVGSLGDGQWHTHRSPTNGSSSITTAWSISVFRFCPNSTWPCSCW